jgi:hypothetical protein
MNIIGIDKLTGPWLVFAPRGTVIAYDPHPFTKQKVTRAALIDWQPSL